MQQPTRFVGLDVHRDSIVAAVFAPLGEAIDTVVLPHETVKLRAFFARLQKEHSVVAAYEAGGFGFGLMRAMASWGVPCIVAAPSLIPSRPGDLVKTDRRDARKIGSALRAHQLVAVHVPSEGEERVRSLVRARESLQRDVHVSQQRVLKLLQLRGISYREGKRWTAKFMAWLKQAPLEGHDRRVLDTHLAQRALNVQLRDDLAREIERVSTDEGFWARRAVLRLRCLHAVDTTTAMTLVAEIVDASRFSSPRSLMSYAGLTPSEFSSGDSVRRGGITRAGSGRLRRIVIEAAWHYRFPPRKSPNPRWEGQDAQTIAFAQRAHARLHARLARLRDRKDAKTAVTAVAREFLGFVWALMREEPGLLVSARPDSTDRRRRRGTTGGTLAAPMR